MSNAPDPQGGSPWSQMLSGQASNKNLFILLGVAGAVLFFCLIYSLVGGGGSGSSAGGPMFPDQGKGGGNSKLPPNPGTVAQKPRDAINGFLRDLHDDRIEDAYARTSRIYKLGQTPEEFRQMMDLKRAFKYYTSYELRPISAETGQVVQYQGKVTGGPYGTGDFTAEVVRDDRGWAINLFVPE